MGLILLFGESMIAGLKPVANTCHPFGIYLPSAIRSSRHLSTPRLFLFDYAEFSDSGLFTGTNLAEIDPGA